MKRRTFLRTVAGGSGLALAGCLTQTDDGSGGDTTTTTTESGSDGATETTTGTATTTSTPDRSGTLKVATYQPFVDSPSTSPGAWIKEEFEKEFPDATLQWQTPESGLNHYIQKANQGSSIDADLYVGLNVDDLVVADEKTSGESLFRPMDRSGLSNASHVKSSLEFDPQNRALPFDTGYISLVYDEEVVENPGTFEALTQPAYEGTLLAQNAQSSDPGQAFLLWTIHTLGEDQYLSYWDALVENDVRITKDWGTAYDLYSNGERPIVVSYSTDQVYAARYGSPMHRHQVGFLNDQGYANPEGMAVFRNTNEPDLARAFVDFMLSKKVQSKIPFLNVQFPATDHAELTEEFDKYAFEPPEAVSFGYDELKGNLNRWVDTWARRIASN